MSKKDVLYEDAKKLYLFEFMSIDAIAEKLNVNRKTIMAWRDEGQWKTLRSEHIKSKTTFHEEMFVFARKLMNDISSDMDAGEKIDPGRMYALCKFVPMFLKVKNYEDNISKKSNKESIKGLTADTIAKIEEEVLGIIHDDTNEAGDYTEEE